MKKIVGIMLACLLLVSGIFIPGVIPVEAEDEVLDITLEKAIELAMEKNSDINLARVGVEKAEKGLNQAEGVADKIEDWKDGKAPLPASLTYLTSYGRALQERVVPRQAEMGLLIAQKSLEAAKNGTKLAVENVYYDVLKFRTELENVADALERAEERLRLAEVGLEAGTSAQLDILNAEVALAGQQVALSAAESNYYSKLMEFNNTVGLPLDTKINLTSSFEFDQFEIDIDEEIEKVKNTDVSYISAQEGKTVAEKQFEEAKKFYTANVYDYKDAQYGYEEAKLKAEKQEKILAKNVKNSYYQMQSAGKAYLASKKALEQAEEAYRLTKLRYEIGMSTQLELEESSGRLDETKASLLESIYNYNLSTAKFRYGVFSFGS